MKTLPFSLQWRTRSRQQLEERRSRPEALVCLPLLPTELWHKVIGFTVRIPGASALELEDPFPTRYEEYNPNIIDPMIFEDRKNLSLVCSTWRYFVLDISMEFLVIRSDKQLKRLVKMLQSCTDRRLGDITKRIDFDMRGDYSVPNVVRLLRMTPNLLIYNNRNTKLANPQISTPVEVMMALVENCGQFLRRVEWNGEECPRYEDVVELCNGLPKLMKLRLIAIYTYPNLHDGVPPILLLPQLKYLSLGTIPRNDFRPQYSLTWDPLLQYLSLNPKQIPLLERFECDIFPLHTMSFFAMHGHKIHTFQITAWSVKECLPPALDRCTNLQNLILIHGADVIPLPTSHPTLKRIYIIPRIEYPIDVPRRIYDAAVIGPLDTLLKSLEGMVAPRLVEVRIRNTGAYVDLANYTNWLPSWGTRWNLRGVQFTDKDGTSYIEVRDLPEPIVNPVRG